MMLYVLSVFDVALFLQFLWDPDQALWWRGSQRLVKVVAEPRQIFPYVNLEPQWPVLLKVNPPPKQGQKQPGSFGF